MVTLILLAACSNSMDMEARAQTQIDAMRSLADAHAEDITPSMTMDEVDTLESDHYDATSEAMTDLSSTMSDMMACEMGSMMDAMSDADMHMTDMMDAPEVHRDAQAGHEEMDDCITEEDAHVAEMNDHLDAMEADMMGFDDEASCDASGGMM